MSPSASSIRLAIIDSDSSFVTVLENRLASAGWEYRVTAGRMPAEEIAAQKLNALLIDVAVLGPDCWEFIERVSGMLPGLGVIICTETSTLAQRVRGLRLGADDWITKPSHPEEVMARIEAVVRRRRRSEPDSEGGPVLVGELTIRPDQFQAFVSGRSLELTRREYELISALADASGRVLEREEIYRRVWGYEMAHGDRSVDVFVRKIRGKLQEASAGWSYIHTHFGVGYRFEAESLTDGPSEPTPVAASKSGPADADAEAPAGTSAPAPAEQR